jgi:hypothetical protein
MIGNWRKNTNPNPCSPNPQNCASGQDAYMHGDAKFQISAKTKLWQDIFDSPLDLWAAYTQQTYWQVYDGKNSRPFRETDFQPEAWLTLPLRVGPEGLQWRMLNLGISHQSNGQNDPLSRSWNRVYATFGLAAGDLSVLIKPWWRLPETGSPTTMPTWATTRAGLKFRPCCPTAPTSSRPRLAQQPQEQLEHAQPHLGAGRLGVPAVWSVAWLRPGFLRLERLAAELQLPQHRCGHWRFADAVALSRRTPQSIAENDHLTLGSSCFSLNFHPGAAPWPAQSRQPAGRWPAGIEAGQRIRPATR